MQALDVSFAIAALVRSREDGITAQQQWSLSVCAAIGIVCGVADLLLACHSRRGALLDVAARAAVPSLIGVRLALGALEVAFLLFVTILLVRPALQGRWLHWCVQTYAVLHWVMQGLMITVVLLAWYFGHVREVLLSWVQRVLHCVAWAVGAKSGDENMASVISWLTSMFEGLEATPTDMVAAEVLLYRVQRAARQGHQIPSLSELHLEGYPWGEEDERLLRRSRGGLLPETEPIRDRKVLQEALRSLCFATAVYGWVLRAYAGAKCRLPCCSCCRRDHCGRQPGERFGAKWNRQAAEACVKEWPGHAASRLVFFSQVNAVKVPAFAVFVDRADRQVVIAVRGTLSVADAVTDAIVQDVELADPSLVGHLAGGPHYVHVGMWEAAQSILQCLDEHRVLERILGAPPDGTGACAEAERPLAGDAWDADDFESDESGGDSSGSSADLEVGGGSGSSSTDGGGDSGDDEPSSSSDEGEARERPKRLGSRTRTIDLDFQAEATAATQRRGQRLSWLHRGGKTSRIYQPKQMPDCHGYRLAVTGHSLGAGTAALLGMLLRRRYSEVRLRLFGCPPVCSKELAEHLSADAISVVNGDDMVARLSVRSLELARDRMLALAAHCPLPKHKILHLGMLKSWQGSTDRYTAREPVCREARACLEAHAGKAACRRFYHVGSPGVVYLRQPQQPRRGYGPLPQKGAGIRAEWAGSDDLQEILLAPGMLQDHVVDRYRDGLEAALWNLARRSRAAGAARPRAERRANRGASIRRSMRSLSLSRSLRSLAEFASGVDCEADGGVGAERCCCPMGHHMTARVTREVCGPLLGCRPCLRAAFRCDFCGEGLAPGQGYYTCSECRLFICMACTHQEWPEVDAPADAVLGTGDIMLTGPCLTVHHVILVCSSLQRADAVDESIIGTVPATELYSCHTIESTPFHHVCLAQGGESWAHAGNHWHGHWYRGKSFLRRDSATGDVTLVGSKPYNGETQAFQPLTVKCLHHPLRHGRSHLLLDEVRFHEAVRACELRSKRYSVRTAVSAVLASRRALEPADYPDGEARAELFAEIRRRLDCKPICASVAIKAWQMYFALAHGGSLSEDAQGGLGELPDVDGAVQEILNWMPVFCDATTPSTMVEVLTEAGWELRADLPALPRAQAEAVSV